MAAPVIPILSNSSKESMGSHVLLVILFGTIPTSIPVIPMVPAEVPIVPADHLVALEVGAVSVISPTGVLDLVDYSSSSSDSDQSKDSLPLEPELPLVSPFLCSDDSEANSESEPAEQRPKRHESLTPSSEFPLAPAIPFGRPYRTHPNGPRTLLTARKRVGPFPGHRLAWRRVSYRSSDHHSSPNSTLDLSSSSSSSDSSSDVSSGSSSDSLSDSSLVHSSRCDASGQSYSGPSTRVASPRSIASTHVDLLPPRKRFGDSYSFEDSGDEHMEIGTEDAEAVANLGISDRVRAHTKDGIGIGIEVATSDIREDEEEFKAEASAGRTMEIVVDPLVTDGITESIGGDIPDLEGTLYDIAHYMSKVPLDRITELETAQRQLEAEALETREANKNIGLRNGNDEGGNGNGDGNEHGGGNGIGNHNENDRGARPVIRECTYQDFMKCQTLNFKGTEGVVGLIRWVEKMETVFHINNYPEKYQVKYDTCTLLNSVLAWWNLHKKTIGTDAAFAMSWKELMKLMAEVYYSRTKIQKMESEL
ncbi:hypothetical protein Tco_0090011 [Tanacetum coccineum]